MAFPKTLGACVDALYKLRVARLDAQKEVDKKHQEESALREYIINTFSKGDLEGAAGKVARVGITRQTVAQVTDWDAFFAYVGEEHAWELVQRRVNDGAYRERLEAKMEVPGTKPYVVTKLNVTKKR